MTATECFVVLNGWKIYLTWCQLLKDKVFAAAYQFIVSPLLPKLISPGPCPLTAAVACSVNKGLVLVRPLLYTQGWSDHSSLLSAIGRQKPGQCLTTQTCGTAFTNFNSFKLRWTLTNSKQINLIYFLAWGRVEKLDVLFLHKEEKSKARKVTNV